MRDRALPVSFKSSVTIETPGDSPASDMTSPQGATARLWPKLRRGRPGDGILRPDHHLLEEFTGTGICHVDLARARLGYAPVFDLGRGLAETAGYLRARAR